MEMRLVHFHPIPTYILLNPFQSHSFPILLPITDPSNPALFPSPSHLIQTHPTTHLIPILSLSHYHLTPHPILSQPTDSYPHLIPITILLYHIPFHPKLSHPHPTPIPSYHIPVLKMGNSDLWCSSPRYEMSSKSY